MSGRKDLFDNIISLMEIEYNIKLTYVAEIFVKTFDIVVNHFEDYELVVFFIAKEDEV
jgi:hypothetical protein